MVQNWSRPHFMMLHTSKNTRKTKLAFFFFLQLLHVDYVSVLSTLPGPDERKGFCAISRK